MGAKVVGAREAFRAQGALEGRGVFLHARAIVAGWRSGWIGKVEDVVAVGDGGRRGAAVGFRCGRMVARAWREGSIEGRE